MSDAPRVTIVGAGLGGSLMAIYLARAGARVNLYERRGDPRTASDASGPSMNLGLSRRGIQALTDAGLMCAVRPKTIPLAGRLIHGVDGAERLQPYGRDESEVIYAIKRRHLNAALLDEAERCPGVRLFFNRRCVEVDKESATAWLKDERTGERVSASADFIVGADGVFSVVRQGMHRGERADYAQEFLEWGWKELTIDPGPGGSHRLRTGVFHLWPRGRRMMFAHPNLDGSFTCSLVLPFEGDMSFASLDTPGRVRAMFETLFPDAAALMPQAAEEFFVKPIVPLAGTRMAPWYFRDRIVLIGDACHAVVPFYAQGMNAAFEDCAQLRDCLAEAGGDREVAFKVYQQRRKRHTDALGAISKANFFELCDKVRSPGRRARAAIDQWLARRFPGRWVPLHAMISHTTVPYADAWQRSKAQDRVYACALAAAALAAGVLVYLTLGNVVR